MTDSLGCIISVEGLAAHLDDADVAIADCRFSLSRPDQGRDLYAAGHIPGAVYFDLERDLSGVPQPHGGRHPLPDLETFVTSLSQAGIRSANPQTLVVAYDDSHFAYAARLWWMLKFLGHDRVAVLDGGFRAWIAAGYPVSDAWPTPTPATFVPHVRSHLQVDIDQVKARKDSPRVALVDSREAERYRGDDEPIDPIAGHIPGAVNYFWKENTDDQGRMRPVDQQRDRWRDLADADEIMVYCGSGVTACVNLLSLELAGLSTGRLYVGSWSDWCSHHA